MLETSALSAGSHEACVTCKFGLARSDWRKKVYPSCFNRATNLFAPRFCFGKILSQLLDLVKL